jgi:hypothetical protein
MMSNADVNDFDPTATTVRMPALDLQFMVRLSHEMGVQQEFDLEATTTFKPCAFLVRQAD